MWKDRKTCWQRNVETIQVIEDLELRLKISYMKSLEGGKFHVPNWGGRDGEGKKHRKEVNGKNHKLDYCSNMDIPFPSHDDRK